MSLKILCLQKKNTKKKLYYKNEALPSNQVTSKHDDDAIKMSLICFKPLHTLLLKYGIDAKYLGYSFLHTVFPVY